MHIVSVMVLERCVTIILMAIGLFDRNLNIFRFIEWLFGLVQVAILDLQTYITSGTDRGKTAVRKFEMLPSFSFYPGNLLKILEISFKIKSNAAFELEDNI